MTIRKIDIESIKRGIARAKQYSLSRGGRHAKTVGSLKKALANLPNDMPVKVLHEPCRQMVGLQDPFWDARNIAVVVSISERGIEVLGHPKGGLMYFVID